MSKALACDNCDTTLTLDRRGESSDGEDAAWIEVTIAAERYDLCTRSCVVAFLDRPEIIKAHDAYSEVITGIAHMIGDRSGGEDDA